MDESRAMGDAIDAAMKHTMPDGSPVFGEDSPHDIGEHLRSVERIAQLEAARPRELELMKGNRKHRRMPPNAKRPPAPTAPPYGFFPGEVVMLDDRLPRLDAIAVAAMQGMLAGRGRYSFTPNELATRCYSVADAMLEESSRREEEEK